MVQSRGMKIQKRILIAGNWKMNPTSVKDAKSLFHNISKGISKKIKYVDVVVAAPYPYLSVLKNKKMVLGAQHVHHEKSGRHTGEVSVGMLKSLDVKYVIIGHSERRAAGETNEHIEKSFIAAVNGGLKAILCIGERKRDSKGNHFNFVEDQFKNAFKKFPKNLLGRVVIAYEPVWAISCGDAKGKTATPADVEEMKLFIQKLLVDSFGRNTIKKVPIIYGGSANSNNAEALLIDGKIDGFLAGGASLRPKEFISMINIAQHYADTHTS